MKSEQLHKGMNWATVAGVIATAVLGYYSDNRKTGEDESIKEAVAGAVAADAVWKTNADADLRTLTEQVGHLRESVATLKGTVEMLSRGRRDREQIRRSVGQIDLGEPLGGTGGVKSKAKPKPAPMPASRPMPVIEQQVVEQYKEQLFKK